jgi:hypothetical protein
MSSFFNALGTFFRILIVGGDRFKPAQASDPRNGILYIYRRDTHANGFDPGISIDGNEYPVLPNARYMSFELKTGSHQFELVVGHGWSRGSVVPFEVEARAPTYLRLEVFNRGGGTPMYVLEAKPVDAAQGELEIRTCRLQDAGRPKFKNRPDWMNIKE